MLDRRDFFKRTLGAALATALAPYLPADLPEPMMIRTSSLTLEQLDAAAKKWILPSIIENFNKPNPFMQRLTDGR